MFYFFKEGENGTYNLMEIYSDRKGNLTAKTFYKTRKDATQRIMDLKKSLFPTSETNSGAILSDAKIPQMFETTSVEERFSAREGDGAYTDAEVSMANNNNSEKQENNESNGSTNAERDSAEGVLFRDGDVTVDDLGERDRVIARDAYERMMSQGRYQFTEAMQDSMMGLKLLYKAILGKKMRVEAVFYDTTFRPMIDAKRVKMKNRRRKFVGSLNTKMPIRAVPSAPMPVHIA